MITGQLYLLPPSEIINSNSIVCTRTAVITALCQLFELASEVESETRHANRVSGLPLLLLILSINYCTTNSF